ncbi:MAG: DUF2089 domain-containing protein [Anaerolineae bacterium]|nr:DUF2089 domain-containing protein [Anaerolineae bacterium]
MQKLTNHCPYCENSEMIIREIECPGCGVRIQGAFQMPDSPFENLTQEQVLFMLNYIRCEGRFNRLEEELNLSYPTLRNRLNDLIVALGFEPGKEGATEPEPEPVPVLTAEQRKKILNDLHEGKITFEEAQARLRGQ